jgi:hypothetical protein
VANLFFERTGKKQKHAVRRWAHTIWLAFMVSGFVARQADSQLSAKRGRKPLNKHRGDLIAKCSYLRDDLRRSTTAYKAFSDSVTFQDLLNQEAGDSTNQVQGWYTSEVRLEALIAKRSISLSKVNSCDVNMPLSADRRIPQLEAIRSRHVRDAQERWRSKAGTFASTFEAELRSEINRIYDQEQQSFSRARTAATGIDPDIAKEFPDLLDLIASSTLDTATKALLADGVRLLKFQEAGHLYRALTGIDSLGLGAAFALRPIVAARMRKMNDSIELAGIAAVKAEVQTKRAAELEAAVSRRKTIARSIRMLKEIGFYVGGVVLLLTPILLLGDKYMARARVIKARRAPYWGGLAEWISWDPGEIVVLYRNKRLIPIQPEEEAGGIISISSLRGEEYRGRVSTKTQLFSWEDERTRTADGLVMKFPLSIWWRVENPRLYVSRIAEEYREEHVNQKDSLMGAAEAWGARFAAGAFRQQISRMSAARVISPGDIQLLQGQKETTPELFAHEIQKTVQLLNDTMREFGIQVQRIVAGHADLPKDVEQTIVDMHTASTAPRKAEFETTAFTIREDAKTAAEIKMLEERVRILGPETLRTVEILREVDITSLAHSSMANAPTIVPIVNVVTESLKSGFSASQPPPELANAAKKIGQLPDEKSDSTETLEK